MHQFQQPIEAIVQVPLTGAASILQPVIFKEGNAFCCILGPNAHDGVFGCGKTPQAAVKAWDKDLKKHLATAAADDEVVKYVQDIINPPMSPELQAIHDKFGLRPVDKNKRKI
jgi:hypothetical protein